MYTFRLYGIDFRSEIALPGARPARGDPDVRIARGVAPRAPADGVRHGPCLVAGDGWVRIDVPDVARFFVREGREIVFEPEPRASLELLTVYLAGSAMGALLLQRGLSPLHASAVEIDGRAVAIMGPSTAGKSTLAATLVQRGCRLLTDDICAVERTADGRALVHPGPRRLKLWHDAAEKLGIDLAGLSRVRDGIEKYEWRPGPSAEHDEPRELEAAVLLQASESGDTAPRTEEIRGAHRFAALVRQTYRMRLVVAVGAESRHHADCFELARSLRLVRLARSRHIDSTGRCADALLASLASPSPVAPALASRGQPAASRPRVPMGVEV